MSGNLVGGILGAAVGFFIPGVGPAIGWSIGSAAGGLLDSGKLPDQYGPRIDDLKVQTSEYFRPIPIIYGQIAVSGNVIWATEISEVSATTTSGGKGGPSQSTTKYSYFGNFAVAICEGEQNISKIWAGVEKRLIYDVEFPIAWGLRLYSGSETQLPDPLIEAKLGVGKAPAYRGTCYAVFENYPLVNDGNRLPLITVEVGAVGPPGWTAQTLPALSYWRQITYGNGVFVVTGDSSISAVSSDGITWAANAIPLYRYWDSLVFGNGVFVVANVGNFPEGGVVARSIDGITWTTHPLPYIARWSLGFGDGQFVGVGYPFSDDITYWVTSIDGINWDFGLLTTTPGYFLNNVDFGNGIFLASSAEKTAISVDGKNWTEGFMPLVGTVSWLDTIFGNGIFVSIGYDYSSNQGVSAVSADGVNWTTRPIFQYYEWASLAFGAGLFMATGYDYTGSANYSVKSTDGLNWTKDNLPSVYSFWEDVGYGNGIFVTVTASRNSNVAAIYQNLAPTVSLSQVVADISVRAGLPLGEIDVTQLTDLVDGYAIARQTSCRAALEVLRPVYYFDSVESDAKVKFVKRGGAINYVVPATDLAANPSNSTSVDDLTTMRKMEVELPRTLSLSYIHRPSSYMVLTKQARRLVGASEEEATMEAPFVLSDSKAQEVVEVNLHTAWVGRVSYKFTLGRAYAALEPSDLITLKGYTMRVIKCSHSTEGIVSFEAVHDEISHYTPNVIMSNATPIVEVVYVTPLTQLELM